MMPSQSHHSTTPARSPQPAPRTLLALACVTTVWLAPQPLAAQSLSSQTPQLF